ncbi:segregation and condensation protein A [Streptomyces sp. NPDC048521]|uniref:segregation and condensation protein A n=1 Tax=Streptomyces sp. NPDC048521 TaxID=3365566 RepID=UPI003713235F
MTSNESGSAGRRRVLGRGPGAAVRSAPAPVDSPPVTEAESPAEPGGHNGGRPEETPEVVVPQGPAAAGPVERSAAVSEDCGVSVPVDPEAAESRDRAPAVPAEPAAGEPEGPAPAVPAEPAGAEVVEPRDGVFTVRLANFEGPFDLLLQLISKHKLDVTEVALSKVTDEFMAHIRAMGPDWDLDQTTEFLVVAATLLDLKAARLLPAAQIEDEADLALLEARDLLFARLLQYRAYKQIADIFNERLDEEAHRHPRTVGLEPEHAELLPEVVISIGPEGFAKLAVKAMQPKPKPQVYVDHIHAPLVSVQEQAGIVVARLKELGEASFRALVADTDDTLTVVARFLALLELYREKAVALEQETALGELTVRWTGGDADAAPMVTDEFDRPREAPEEEKKA